MLQAPEENIPPGLTHFLLGANLLSGNPCSPGACQETGAGSCAWSGVQSWNNGGRGSTEQWALSLLSVPSVPSGPFLVSHLGDEDTSWAAREECN